MKYEYKAYNLFCVGELIIDSLLKFTVFCYIKCKLTWRKQTYNTSLPPLCVVSAVLVCLITFVIGVDCITVFKPIFHQNANQFVLGPGAG